MILGRAVVCFMASIVSFFPALFITHHKLTSSALNILYSNVNSVLVSSTTSCIWPCLESSSCIVCLYYSLLRKLTDNVRSGPMKLASRTMVLAGIRQPPSGSLGLSAWQLPSEYHTRRDQKKKVILKCLTTCFTLLLL